MAGFDRIRQTDNQILTAIKSIHTLYTIHTAQSSVRLVTKCRPTMLVVVKIN